MADGHAHIARSLTADECDEWFRAIVGIMAVALAVIGWVNRDPK